MPLCVAPLVLVVAPLVAPAAPKTAEKAYTATVSTDRADALYEIGDEVRFLVTVAQGKQPVTEGEVAYVLDDEGPNRIAAGSAPLGDKPTVISGRMSKPGFMQCRAIFKGPGGKPVQGIAGAGISPTKIQPSLPAPDDFDAFWNDQKAQLARVPMNPKLTEAPSSDPKVECFDVQLQCLGGAPVSGYFARPKGAKPKSLPAVLWVQGAGVRSSRLAGAISGAQMGMLSMDINAHGIANGKPAAFYQELKQGRLKGYPRHGNKSRDTCYFRGMYLRLVRAIDFLTSQPEWDGKVLAVTGHSQGGGQSLAAGGLDQRVTAIAAGVPAMCDHSGRAANRINGWPKLVPTGSDGKPDPEILKASRYFDAVNFAARSKADAVMSVGFVDRTCPPTTCYAAYNQLQGKKQVINEPHMGHSAPSHIHQAFREMILAHVKERTGKK